MTYPSDLTDAEWECLQRYLPAAPKRGRPRTHPLRTILNAIFYLLRTGCPWRYLPRNFPPWQTVFYHFRRWRLCGDWHGLFTALRVAERRRVGKEAIREGSARWHCTICEQTWTNGRVRSRCPGILTFASWTSVPPNFVTWTELRRQPCITSRAVPHAAVRTLKAPYFRYLYDLHRSTPVLMSETRQAAIAKAKATSQAHFTCRICGMYYASLDERKAFVAQVCKHCQWEVREWNRRVAWAREMLDLEAVLLEVETRQPDPGQPGQPVGCTLLDLASGTTLRSGAITPADAPALAALIDHPPTPVLTWDGEGLWPLRDWAQAVTGQLVLFGRMERLAGHLTRVRQGERVVAWQNRPYRNGSPGDDLAWYCAAYGIEAGPTRLETMRRLVLHLAAQDPLVLEEPRKEQPTHARRAA